MPASPSRWRCQVPGEMYRTMYRTKPESTGRHKTHPVEVDLPPFHFLGSLQGKKQGKLRMPRRCIVFGRAVCQYRRVSGNGVSRRCPEWVNNKLRFACLRSKIRAEMRNANGRLDRNDPNSVAAWLDDWDALLKRLDTLVTEAFPSIEPARVASPRTARRQCWMVGTGCQFRLGVHGQPCDMDTPLQALTCRLSCLRFVIRRLFIDSTPDVCNQLAFALAMFRGRLLKLYIAEQPAVATFPVPRLPISKVVSSARAFDIYTLRSFERERDLKGLEPDEWINGNVMDGYIALLQHHFYPTNPNLNLCYQGLCEDLQDFGVQEVLDMYPQPMFGPGKVTCIPVNFKRNEHWSLVIVDERDLASIRVLLADSTPTKNNAKKKNLVPDSWLPKQLLEFLYIHLPNWDRRIMQAHSVQQRSRTPESANCGLHVIQNMEFVARHANDPHCRFDKLEADFARDNVGNTMSDIRLKLIRLCERLIACQNKNTCLQDVVRSQAPFMYPS